MSTEDNNTAVPETKVMEPEKKVAQKKSTYIYRPLVWIDCEMTGLDHKNDVIIEVCAIITDGNLNIIDEAGYESVVYCPKEKLESMGEWCLDHHTKSGLVERCSTSVDRTMEVVEEELLAYLKKYIPNQNVGLLAGSSIHMDKIFLMKDMPKIVEHLHYRLVDVSTVMELCKRLNNPLFNCMARPVSDHTAKKDILNSINLMRWYNEHFFKSPNDTKLYVQEHNLEKKKKEEEEEASKKLDEEQEDEPIIKKQKTE
ncbi:hypothetical protein QEN19_001935 [Hanseniaspora menglaensis]